MVRSAGERLCPGGCGHDHVLVTPGRVLQSSSDHICRQTPPGTPAWCSCLSPCLSPAQMAAEIDECWSQPCLNGGHCKDRVAEFLCLCEPGYTGHRCESGEKPCQVHCRAVAGSYSKSLLAPQSLGSSSGCEPRAQELGCLGLCALASVSCLHAQISLRRGLLSRSPWPVVGCAGGELRLLVRWRSRQGCRGTCATCVPLLTDAVWASPSLMGW